MECENSLRHNTHGSLSTPPSNLLVDFGSPLYSHFLSIVDSHTKQFPQTSSSDHVFITSQNFYLHSVLSFDSEWLGQGSPCFCGRGVGGLEAEQPIGTLHLT